MMRGACAVLCVVLLCGCVFFDPSLATPPYSRAGLKISPDVRSSPSPTTLGAIRVCLTVTHSFDANKWISSDIQYTTFIAHITEETFPTIKTQFANLSIPEIDTIFDVCANVLPGKLYMLEFLSRNIFDTEYMGDNNALLFIDPYGAAFLRIENYHLNPIQYTSAAVISPSPTPGHLTINFNITFKKNELTMDSKDIEVGLKSQCWGSSRPMSSAFRTTLHFVHHVAEEVTDPIMMDSLALVHVSLDVRPSSMYFFIIRGYNGKNTNTYELLHAYVNVDGHGNILMETQLEHSARKMLEDWKL
eukprot:TRINITY_DN16094_c0_g1_i2.p1 TRINITY_DN16094_c0_g1~~TRINITY_DN16094_c0_g1_i2.p1  ORF type:complete len:303 (-),score=35.49 TRINITY_DN16094_c0_g1_i2:167-1075(-)